MQLPPPRQCNCATHAQSRPSPSPTVLTPPGDTAPAEAQGDALGAEAMGDDDVQDFGGGDELGDAGGFGFGFEEAGPSAAQLAEVGGVVCPWPSGD